MKDHSNLICSALDHVKSRQSPDGSFVNLSGLEAADFSTAISRRTTFFTANILGCLQNIPPMDPAIQRTGVAFLLSQKSDRWTFNYWTRGSKENSEFPYPDDLDDTFAALSAIRRHDQNAIGGDGFAAIAKMLIATEIEEGGPYRTWLKPDNNPAVTRNADLVVNSTIGYFLSLIDVKLPALTAFIDNEVRKGMLISPYYPGIFHVGYFLSRFYKNTASDGEDARETLADILGGRLKKYGNEALTTLEHAMAISSLTNLGHPEMLSWATPDRLAKKLEQEGFRPYAFCIDPARDGKRSYAGSCALTAAFCAEAFAISSPCNPGAEKILPTADKMTAAHDHIIHLAQKTCTVAGAEIRSDALAQIEKMRDTRISSLAYEFQKALGAPGSMIPADVTESLALASLYGWMAYSLYDHALDDEPHAAALLPCANFFLRTLSKIYSGIAGHAREIQVLFDKTMDQIDNANAWEQKNCRMPNSLNGSFPRTLPPFGDYNILADRSIGHGMGPLAQLLFLGYTEDSEEYKNTGQFFRHYLIARQLHDDAHDWADDMLRGRMNSVGARIIARFHQKYPAAAEDMVVADIIPELQILFWEEVIDQVSDMIVSQIAAARAARGRFPILSDVLFMESALKDLEAGARRGVKERNEAIDFLKHYRGSGPLASDSKNR
jgi:hypothetical protein